MNSHNSHSSQDSNLSVRLIITDWGSSNLRSFLIDQEGQILSSLSQPFGIWRVPRSDMIKIYREVHRDWLRDHPDIVVLVGGMAGSVEGLQSVAYRDCPATLKNLSEMLVPYPPLLASGKAYLVPGIRTLTNDNDVDLIRGEEIQALGASVVTHKENGCMCLPGTHSKWLKLRKGAIAQFATFATGEVFDTIRRSPMFASLAPPENTTNDENVFLQGVDRSRSDPRFLHHLFNLRARVISGFLHSEDIYAYLSGLVIGTEISEVAPTLHVNQEVQIVGNSMLARRYQLALERCSIPTELVDSELATVQGAIRLARNAELI